MNANRELWNKGDFTQIAETMRVSGGALVDQLNLAAGTKMLDLGCGDGTTAIPGAKKGADVTGVDIAPNLVAAARRRAAEEGLTNCSFEEGDARDLSEYSDDTFELTLSMFGAMFASEPMQVASEMVRVTRPGGRIVMGNWIPGDPTMVAEVLKVSAAYSPPPPSGFVSPVSWGVEENVRERFGAAGIAPERISCDRATYRFLFDGPPEELLARFRAYYGPTMNAFAAAAADGRAERLQAELAELFAAHNESGDSQTTAIPATYLRVEVAV